MRTRILNIQKAERLSVTSTSLIVRRLPASYQSFEQASLRNSGRSTWAHKLEHFSVTLFDCDAVDFTVSCRFE